MIYSLLLQRSIQITNARYRLRNSKKKSTTIRKKENCIYFNRFGKCHRGDKCPFIHDRSRIAVCTQYVIQIFQQNFSLSIKFIDF